MKEFKLMETQLPELYSRGLYDEYGWDLGASETDKVASVFFIGTSEALKASKSKDYPVAMVFDEPNGTVNAAAIVRYIPSETKDQPGHWNYVWTCYKEDIPENARVIHLKDDDFQVYYRTVAGTKYNFGFKTPGSMVDMGNFLMKSINKWLTDNATPDDKVMITLDGIFQARAEVEDNEVVKSIEVIGETKAIIKTDATEEV